MGDKLTIDFKLLPPDLQVKVWVLGLHAETDKVNIAYKTMGFNTGLTYNYGGNIEAFASIDRMTTTLGVSPKNGDLKLNLVYRGFNFGANGSVATKSGGLSFGYGSALLPFPDELKSSFDLANGGLMNMAGDIAAAPNNPLAWYNLHKNDAAVIGQAVSTIQSISKINPKSNNFGAGLRINYSEQSGLTIFTGISGTF